MPWEWVFSGASGDKVGVTRPTEVLANKKLNNWTSISHQIKCHLELWALFNLTSSHGLIQGQVLHLENDPCNRKARLGTEWYEKHRFIWFVKIHLRTMLTVPALALEAAVKDSRLNTTIRLSKMGQCSRHRNPESSHNSLCNVLFPYPQYNTTL